MTGALTRKQIAELCSCQERDIPLEPTYSLLHYETPGPIATKFIRSQGPIDVITGPSGSGKTVAAIFKSMAFSVGVMPVCRDGRVRVQGTVVRDNYRALYRTTLRTWFKFFPPNWSGAHFTGGQDRPAQHILKLSTVRDGREVPVDLVVDFFAVGDTSIEDLLKGYETSWGLCEEADLLHKRVIPFLFDRTGRYPALDTLAAGTLRPRMVAAAMNPPDLDHPLWKACINGSFQEEDPDAPRGPEYQAPINFFQQPSGLSAEAENRKGKTYAEYEAASRTLPKQEVRRFVLGQPGYSLDGKPVYEDFDIALHRAGGTLEPVPAIPLDLGFDQGLSPACVISQELSTGQVRVYAELVPDHGTGATRFLEMLRVLLGGRFRGLALGRLTADPAGFYGADRIAGELSWAEMVGVGLGKMIMPAPSNEPAIRIEAVRLLLRNNIAPGQPALLVDPSCKMLIGGFAAHYKFRRMRDGASDRYEQRPYKNSYANAHDALQYDVLGVRGRAGVIHDAARAGRPGNVVPLAPREMQKPGDFSVWSV